MDTIFKNAISILSEKVVHNGFFRIVAVTFKHRKFDRTWSEPILRYVFERGPSVAALLHDTKNGQIILTEQVRIATIGEAEDGLILELPAGMVDPGEDVFEAIKREIVEETGYKLSSPPRGIFSGFVSPGGTDETMDIIYAEVFPNPIGNGGGLDSENEDIRVVKIDIDKALEMLHSVQIKDMKTAHALQWLELQIELGNIEK